MLSKDIWHEAAIRANLSIGQSRRFRHSCGDGTVVQVSMTMKGLSAYCHRCNDSLLVRRELSLAEQVAELKARNESYSAFSQCQLPSDYTLDIPPQYAVWLYKASIRKAQAREHGIGWSPSMQRILLPVYSSSGELAFVQARAVKTGQLPKYINTKGQAASTSLFMTSTINSGTPFAIITEDILSSIRTGRYAPSCALCGTSVNDSKILKLLDAQVLLVWLDPDGAGTRGTHKFIKALCLLHDDVRIIKSAKDPKFLTDSEIQQHIERSLCS